MSGAPGRQCVGVPHSPCPRSVAVVGMGMSVWGRGCPSLGAAVCHRGGPWAHRLGVGGCQAASSTSLTLFSAVLPRGAPLPPQPSETVGRRAADHGPDSQIPHCLRGRGIGAGARGNVQRPPSLCCCLSNCASHLSPLCTASSATDLPSPPPPVGAGWARSSIPPCLLSFSVGLARAQPAVMHGASI